MKISAAIVLILVPEPFRQEVRMALAFPTRGDVDDLLSACLRAGRSRTDICGIFCAATADRGKEACSLRRKQ